MKPKRGTANHLPPAAGGTRLRGPTRRGDFFSWTGRGPFSFWQDQKENGGRIAASNLASPVQWDAYGSSRHRGILIHRGPPRPRDSSALGIVRILIPASSRERLVT